MTAFPARVSDTLCLNCDLQMSVRFTVKSVCPDVRKAVPVERTASGDAVVAVKRPEGCKLDIVVKLTVKTR